MKPLAISELNAQIKSILETTFMDIYIQGEISTLTLHTSGHIYFSLKDEHSSVRCVMFKGNAKGLKIQLEVGQNVQVNGSISVYAPKGEYQILCKSITLAGIGELMQNYEALKAKLQTKGYFDSSHKKPLPSFPKRIALLTSATGAAKADMLKIAKKRWENVHIVLFNTLVQGTEAKDSIAQNIKLADSFYGTKDAFDVLIVGRGGGSMEDMWAFNEEIVAEAIFEAKTPIISAVGHEVDYFISDFVADMRAPTPSGAMELLLPDKDEYLRTLDEMANHLTAMLKRHIAHKEQLLTQMFDYFHHYNFTSQYNAKNEQIKHLRMLLVRSVEAVLQNKATQLQDIAPTLKHCIEERLNRAHYQAQTILQALTARNPSLLCANGYAQVSQHNKPLMLKDLQKGDEFELQDISHTIKAICTQSFKDL